MPGQHSRPPGGDGAGERGRSKWRGDPWAPLPGGDGQSGMEPRKPMNARAGARRRQSREALRESEERFRAIWESASDAMALSDPDGIVLLANPAYYELYGYTADEVIGRSFAIIFPPAARGGAVEHYRSGFGGLGAGPAFAGPA